MHLYRLLSRVLRRSYVAKVFAVAVIATHVPVVVALLLEQPAVFHGPEGARLIAILAVADLVGLVACAIGLRAILKPVFLVGQNMESFVATGEYAEMPQGFEDEAGRVLALGDRLLGRVQVELTQSRTAAETDPLTGLLNRRGFDRLGPDHQGCIVYFDLDRFKMANDLLGHSTGDFMLKRTAQILRDAMGEGGLVARFGGDEFVLMLPHCDISAARDFAEDILRRIKAELSSPLGPFSASAGVSMKSREMRFDDALSRADRALYEAKAAGRNCVRVDAGLRAPPASFRPAKAQLSLAK